MSKAITSGGFQSGMRMIPENEKLRLEQQYSPSMSIDSCRQSQEIGPGNGQIHQLPTRIVSLPPAPDTPQEVRSLPCLDVSDEGFDDAYVEFIMFCNPNVPLDADTTELRRIFRAPPKSDGKNFDTFVLFELIRKLESKDIKTWAQLALELGVEPPALEKGQSAQKVQQYAVRLKRWMHAMHVDAFFEYLLNKSHLYFTRVPAPNDTPSEVGRDGVAAEEDLALRALLPETRPKRGRRKAEDKDENVHGKSPSQRPRLDSPSLSEDIMMARSGLIADNTTPATAHPDFQQSLTDRMAPWSATPSMPSTFRWPPPDSATPMTAYPQSAITPTNRQLWNDANEPQSAITPKSKARRRHGPAVSSAWPSNGSVSSRKLRGRPSTNRSVQDGPFSTFPANPGARDVPTINVRDNTPSATPIVANSETLSFFPPAAALRVNCQNQPTQTGRPSGLHLQVPQRQGGTVRLATPPSMPRPILFVNGQDEPNMHRGPAPLMEIFSNPVDHDPALQNFVNITFRHNEDTDRTNVDALESHFISAILAAECYDASGASIERCSIDEADKICKQVVKNLQAESSSTEAFLINLSALAGGPLMTRLRMTRLEQGTVAHYECHWKMRFGSLEGDFTIRAMLQRDNESADAGLENKKARLDDLGESEGDWKKRYLDLQQQLRDRDKKVGNLKRNILDALVLSQ
ncbi:related to ars binding protein 2 [Rhynchosporium secalis]|uniref:Related to ars binding protein 2 n=1 Tax=Rhynchosporium secalis TaxID=38038 RepID=A0A1E1LZA2_RHYSE|nr:related to ars binding protein 2 [Rhynchosporium secalis]